MVEGYLWLLYLLIFVGGICLGSFLNVVIDRWPRGQSIRGRSACEYCRHPLGVADLFPLFSWLILRGRCRYCGQWLSCQYPLVELGTGILFVVAAYVVGLAHWESLTFGSLISLLFYLFIAAIFVVIFMVDLKNGIVLEGVVLPAILITALYRIFLGGSQLLFLYFSLKNDRYGLGPYLLRTDFLRQRFLGELTSLALTLLGAVVVAVFFWLVIKLTRGRGMGEGDVWLGFLVGLVVGFPNFIVAIFLAFVLGATVSLVLIMLGRKHFGQTVPFGPFLSMAALLALFWGDKLFLW